MIPFHNQEEEENEGGERNVLEQRYSPLSWTTHKESTLLRSIQPSLEMREILASLIFLIPKAPKSLGRQMESHALRERFLDLSEEKPYQKFLKHPSS